jgi:hypothetical protein
MAYWKSLVVDGSVYDLSHLEPFLFHALPRGMAEFVTINVRVHDHCFTEAFNPAKHQTSLNSSQYSAHEKRAFDLDRYELSRNLPNFVRQICGKKITSTRNGNLARVELANGDKYAIFFTLRRANNRRADLFVVSAFRWQRSDAVASTGSMKFDVALSKILQRKPLKFPHK